MDDNGWMDVSFVPANRTRWAYYLQLSGDSRTEQGVRDMTQEVVKEPVLGVIIQHAYHDSFTNPVRSRIVAAVADDDCIVPVRQVEDYDAECVYVGIYADGDEPVQAGIDHLSRMAREHLLRKMKKGQAA